VFISQKDNKKVICCLTSNETRVNFKPYFIERDFLSISFCYLFIFVDILCNDTQPTLGWLILFKLSQVGKKSVFSRFKFHTLYPKNDFLF
jgi:hypothetical protein